MPVTGNSAYAEEAKQIVQRLFVRAAQRVGGAVTLGLHLGFSYSELRLYLSGEAVPPTEVLLQTLELVLDDLDVVKDGCSEQAWRYLFGTYLATRTR
jgi:hypothetical protein